MKILVSDALDKQAVAEMEKAGFEVTVKTGMSPEELLDFIGPFDAIVVRSATKVKREVIEKGVNLKVIGRAGVGLDNVDRKAAEERGIKVVNTPAATSISVAELALGMMFAAARQIPRGTAGTKAGKWEKGALKGIELYGKTLGIVGCGRIGQELGRRAHVLGMKVLGNDLAQYCDMDRMKEANIIFEENIDKVLAEADFISLHLPLTDGTRNMIDKNFIAKMKDGAIIVNCARGGIVHEQDLAEALASGKIAAAAFDVFETEPVKADNPLLAQDNFICTPHIGANTKEGQKRAGMQIAEAVVNALKS